MPPISRERPAIGLLTPDPVPALASTPVALPNNLFQEFMRTYIKKVQDQALAAPAVLAVEARDNIDRPLKP